MSSSTHQIVLTARDSTQAAFTAIERGAKQDAAALQQMGQQGSRAFTDVERGSTQAARGAETFNRAFAAMGVALGTAGGLLSEWSRNAQDAAAIHRQLEQAIQNTGHAFSEYATQIQAAGDHAVQLGIDDEKAFQAIQALTEITGNAGTALSLLGTAEDVAAAKGMDLVSAAELVGRVHEGNTGILQRYGIVVQQGATAEEALAQIQQQTAGQAEAHATVYARLREELSNVTDAIGGTVGGFAPFLSMLPGLSVGFTAITGAIGALVPEMTAATIASVALDTALGPIGLVLAAGAAAVAIYELTKSHHQEADAAKQAAVATKDLAATIAQLNAAGATQATPATKWAADLKKILDDAGKQIDDINHKIQQPPDTGGVPATEQYNDQLKDLEKVVRDTAAAQDALNKILSDTGTGAGIAMQKTKDLFDQYEHGQVSLRDFEARLIAIAASLNQYDIDANRAAKTADAFTAAEDRQAAAQASLYQSITGTTVAMEGETRAVADHITALKNYAQAAYDAAHAAKELALGHDATIGSIEQEGTAIKGVMDVLNQSRGAIETFAHDHESAFSRIERGSTSAAVAFRAFADAQDNLIRQENVFSQQASEYSQQVNAMTAAHDLLAKRQEEGVALTKEQARFMDQYDEALGRAQGGVEDATIAQGILAEQYALNMEKGDQMRDSLDGVNKTSGELTDAIRELIETLNGLPPEKHTDVSVPGATESQQQVEGVHAALADLPGVTSPAVELLGVQAALDGIGAVSGALAALDGQTAFTEIVNTTRNTVINDVINTSSGIGKATGGLVSAAGGRMLGASYFPVRVNEGGQETATLPTGDNVWLPGGSTVWPHAASVMGNRGRGGIRTINNYGSIHVHANNPEQFWSQMDSYGLAGR